MPVFVQWTLPATSGFPADNVINTFSFSGGTADIPACLEKILNFYNEQPADTDFAVGQMINNTIDRLSYMSYKAWVISGANVPLGEPDLEGVIDDALINPLGENNLPQEVALALSFEMAPGAGPTARRRRGRVYIGPLVVNISDEGGDFGQSPARPNTDAMNVLGEAGRQFLRSGSDNLHSVWSRAAGVVLPVDRYSVDDEFDSQRRRGRLAIARIQYPAGS